MSRSENQTTRDPSDATLEAFVDRRPTQPLRVFGQRRRRDLFARFALTFERLGDLTGKRGLDVGCGSGPYLVEAIRRGVAHVVGIDPAPGMLELARGKIEQVGQLERVTLLEGYFPDTVPEGPFDFAVAVGVLDYVSDPVAFLRALRTILTGNAVVSFPAKHWLRTPIRKFRQRKSNSTVNFYDERQIDSLGEQAGFRTCTVNKIEGAGGDYHVWLAP